MRTVEIDCRGCWKIVALGISTKTYKQHILDRQGEIKAVVERLLPSHGLEVCQTCGRVHKFPGLGGKLDKDYGTIWTSAEKAWRQAENIVEVEYVYRGPPTIPAMVSDPTHWLPEEVEDEKREDWL
jgi:hypothetical protein